LKYQERLIECPVKIVIATTTNRKTGTTGTANSQQECYRSQDLRWAQTAYYRGSQESLSPHERNQTRDRSNSLHRKKINTTNPSRAVITKVTTVLFVVLVIDTNEDAEASTGSAYLYG
jgi:hypothetical protein